MVAAIIPAAIAGIILLIITGRFLSSSSAFFPSASEQKARNEKGAVGNTVDFIAGEGTAAELEEEINQKGLVGAAVDKVAGQGAYAAGARSLHAQAGGALQYLDDRYTEFQVGLHNAITDPFNYRGIPDLQLSHVKELERRGVNVRELNAQQIHDLVLGGALNDPVPAPPAQKATPDATPSGGVEPSSTPAAAPLTIGQARGIVLEGI